MKNAEIVGFQKQVWSFYKKEGRHSLPWRKTKDPYKILVSEVMLQQTQVDRVIPKYKAFLAAFPTVVSLSKASNGEVLKLWSGLGYNRRALFLKRAAEAVVSQYKGKFPKDAETLENLPGVGPYTARAVATFSFDASYVFIETNIRAVFISVFFPKSKKVSDSKIIPLIEQSLPQKGKTRDWYFALMDYGVFLKKTLPNPSRKSAHHSLQSPFKGSLRQIRGKILRECMKGGIAKKELIKAFKKGDTKRVEGAILSLLKEGFLTIDSGGKIAIKNS